MAVIARLTLDTYLANTTPVLVMPEGDYRAREIEVRITAMGRPVPVRGFVVVTITAERLGDGAVKTFAGSANKNGTVMVPITQWMLEKMGTVQCTVSVTGEDFQYSTNYFSLSVQRKPSMAEPDTPEADVLAQLLLAEGERAAAEESREEAEGDRADAEAARVEADAERELIVEKAKETTEKAKKAAENAAASLEKVTGTGNEAVAGAFAAGLNNKALTPGSASIGEGNQSRRHKTTGIGKNASFGLRQTAWGDGAISAGWSTNRAGFSESGFEWPANDGNVSDAMLIGYWRDNAFSLAKGLGSLALGIDCLALSRGSAAIGEGNIAEFAASTALGRGTRTTIVGQFAAGTYNDPGTNLLFALGNGTSDNARSNAAEIDKNGNMKLAGMLTTPSAPLNSAHATNKGYVDNKVAAVKNSLEADISTVKDSLEADISTVKDSLEADISTVKDSLEAAKNTLSEHSARIKSLASNMSLMADGFLADFQTVHTRQIPSNALPYAAVTKIGGSTLKCTNILDMVQYAGFETAAPYKDTKCSIDKYGRFHIQQGVDVSNVENREDSLKYEITLPENGCSFCLTYYGDKKGSDPYVDVRYFRSGSAFYRRLGVYSSTFDKEFIENLDDKKVTLSIDYSFGIADNADYYVGVQMSEGVSDTAVPYMPYFEGLKDVYATDMIVSSGSTRVYSCNFLALYISAPYKGYVGYGQSNPDDPTEYNYFDFANKKYVKKGYMQDGVWIKDEQEIPLPEDGSIFDPAEHEDVLTVANGSITLDNSLLVETGIPMEITYQIKQTEEG